MDTIFVVVDFVKYNLFIHNDIEYKHELYLSSIRNYMSYDPVFLSLMSELYIEEFITPLSDGIG